MSVMNEEITVQKSGLEIQSALLHVVDGRRHQIYLSERTLDLEDEMIEKYVKRYLNRCVSDARAKRCSFHEDSPFEKQLDSYFHQKISLAEFSAEVLKDIIAWFEHEEARSFEILIADCRNDDVPYLAVIFLEEVETMAYFSDVSQGKVYNTITFNHSSLPTLTKPLSAFALINMITEEIALVDEGKWKDDIHLLCEKLLDAREGISNQEIIENVREIAVEVAEEFDENPALILGRVKNHISETVNEGMTFSPKTLAEEVFEEEPKMAEVFLRKAESRTIPQEVELPKKAVKPSMKKQKIVTDGGIEITFPSEYANDPKMIEFVRNEDGTTTIEIKNVQSFETKY